MIIELERIDGHLTGLHNYVVSSFHNDQVCNSLIWENGNQTKAGVKSTKQAWNFSRKMGQDKTSTVWAKK